MFRAQMPEDAQQLIGFGSLRGKAAVAGEFRGRDCGTDVIDPLGE
jgi:hypothetical protein